MKRLFKGLRGRSPEASYDAVIIGAGIGGLICANLLARESLRVLLVEQHYMVGGYCSTFRRKGFTFDAATHFYPLLGNPATITGKLLRELGVTNGWVKMDPVDHFHFPDGSTFAVPADFDTYLSKLKQEFPHEVENLDRFFTLVREVYLSGLLTYFRWRETDRLDQYSQMTVREALDQHFRDPKLKLLLAADCGHWGSPPSRTSFVFDSMLRLSYFLGNYYPRGGSQAFADELALRFEELGGHILTSAKVNRIVVRNESACGVEIQTQYVNAGAVISNADLLLTLEQLIEPDHVNRERVACIRSLRPTHPCFLVHVGLKGMETEVLRAAHGYHWDSWDSDRVATDSFKIFVPTLYEPEMAPAGGHIVIVQKLTDINYDSIEDWAGHKAKVEAYIMQNLERVMPGFTEKVVVKLSASALTSHRFTLNHKGAMLGWEMSPDQLGANRPALNGLLKNLYFVGHWTQPGGGITPVIVSAMQVARKITGTPKAFANFSPGLERSDNPGDTYTREDPNPERVCRGTNPFRVDYEFEKTNPAAASPPDVIQVAWEIGDSTAAASPPDVIQIGREIGDSPAAASPPDVVQVGWEISDSPAAASPPDVIQVAWEISDSNAAASPPDVRRGSAPPFKLNLALGSAPGSGSARAFLGAKPRTRGIAQKLYGEMAAGQSPASHRAAKPQRN